MLPSGGDPGDFAPASRLWAGERALEVASARPYRDRGLIVAFRGIQDRNAAEALRGAVLTREAGLRRALAEGEFWSSSLLGLEAVTPAGVVLGRVSDVRVGRLQDRLVVTTPAGDEVEVPFVGEMVGDPAGGRIVVDPPEGLFPD